MESILGYKFPKGFPLEEYIKDGQVLCKLINTISPGSVPKYNTTGGQFKMMENINLWVPTWCIVIFKQIIFYSNSFFITRPIDIKY